MRKKILLLVILIIINAEEADSKTKLIGGFSAPIFFTHYDQSLVNSICANQNNPKGINVSYPANLKKLAIKIIDGIDSKCKLKVNAEQLELNDTRTVKYRHDAVIVVLKFN